MKYLVFGGFFVLIIIQWLVPVNMIRQNNDVLENGKTYRFETQPIDPSMPFTGKYVALNFKASEYKAVVKDSFKTGENIFILLANDSAGFAKINSISRLKPGLNADHVKATFGYAYYTGDTLFANINYPFTKFYMDEYKAPAAETEYRNANLDSSKKTFALVSILNGEAVIKDVLIDNKSLKDLVPTQKK